MIYWRQFAKGNIMRKKTKTRSVRSTILFLAVLIITAIGLTAGVLSTAPLQVQAAQVHFQPRINVFQENGNLMTNVDDSNMPSSPRLTFSRIMLVRGARLRPSDIGNDGRFDLSNHTILVDSPVSNSFVRNTVINWNNGFVDGDNVVAPVSVLGGFYTVILVGTDRGPLMVSTTRFYYFNDVFFRPLTPVPTPPSGHYFAGWYLDSYFTQPLDNNPITADVNLYARFNPIVYNITYNLNGGTLTNAPQTFTVLDEIQLPISTRNGHHFRGWYTNAGLTGQPIETIQADTIGDITLFARWEIKRFIVTFIVSGQPYQNLIVDWGTVFSSLTFINPITGELARLYNDFAMNSPFDVDNRITGDTVIFTNGSIGIFVSLTHYVLGETTTQIIPLNDRFGVLKTVYREGLVFEGWYYDRQFTRLVQVDDRLTSNTTIYARFSIAPEPTPATFWERFGGIIIGGSVVLGVVVVLFILGLIAKKIRGR